MPEDAEAATSDLTMRMGSAGVRRELAEVLGIELAARADASLVRMEIGAGPEFIGGVSADSWRARVGLEGKRRLALGEETALTPFMGGCGTAGRRGDGLEGSGLEVAGGGAVHGAAGGGGGARSAAVGARRGGCSGAGRERDRATRPRGGRSRAVAVAQAALGRGHGGRGGAVARRVAGAFGGRGRGGVGRPHRLRGRGGAGGAVC